MNTRITLLEKSLFSIAMLALSTGKMHAQDSTKIKVLDDTDHTAVAAEIHCYPLNGQSGVIGHTDEQTGEAVLTKTPTNGDRLYIKPDDGDHLNKRLRWPLPQGMVLVRRPRNASTMVLLSNLSTLRKGDEDAKIALVANELSQVADPASRSAFEPEVYQAFAKTVAVPAVDAVTYDSKQQKVVPSDILVSAVKTFQKEQGLNPTGDLNYPTLRAKAGVDISVYQNTAQ